MKTNTHTHTNEREKIAHMKRPSVSEVSNMVKKSSEPRMKREVEKRGEKRKIARKSIERTCHCGLGLKIASI